MGVAADYKLYQHIRFNTTVESATWDEQTKKWKVSVSTAKGSKDAEFCEGYVIDADFLVSAVGQLNVPKYPDIPGLKEFKGKIIHSARWDWSYDLQGKKVAVVGNGKGFLLFSLISLSLPLCTSFPQLSKANELTSTKNTGATAVQIIPEIAKAASKIGVYQRTPNWLIPRLDAPIPSWRRTLYSLLPPLMWRKRALQMDFREGFHQIIGDVSSAGADEIRGFNSAMLDAAFGNNEAMKEKLQPKYQPGCKRIIISDDYYPALALPHVELITEGITAITPTGITTEATSTQDYDLIILATGFETLDFMHPISMTGYNNTALSQVWAEGAKALYGITVSDMPNFSMLYGPNTNLGHNSIILMIEAQASYIASLIQPILTARQSGKHLSIRPKSSRMQEFNSTLQKELAASAFADENCNSWYKTASGLITNNWSRNVVEYQKLVETVQWDDFEIEGDGEDVLKGRKESKIGRVREESLVGDRTLSLLGAVSVGAVVLAGVWARAGGARAFSGLLKG